MSETTNKPVIFLAFANDRDDTVGYLRNLPDETRRLRDTLEPAEAAGSCEVVVRYNNRAMIQDTVSDYKAAISIGESLRNNDPKDRELQLEMANWYTTTAFKMPMHRRGRVPLSDGRPLWWLRTG